LPDISKINALAITSVSKVDGLAKASILDIDGVAIPAAPAVAAYSVRLLDSLLGVTYTGAAMRVRRDTAGGTGDDDEADIAFDSGVISLDSAISNASAGVTATTLGEFLNVGTVNSTTYSNPDSLSGTASCWVNQWKDQSGNGNHASNPNFVAQTKIHDGTVDTDLITENGEPAMTFGTFNQARNLDASIGTISQPFTAFMVAQGTWVQQFPYFYSAQSSNICGHGQILGTDRLYAGTALASSGYDETQKLFTDLFNGASSIMRQNGSQTGSGNVGSNSLVDLSIGRLYSPSNGLQGSMQELIIYDADKTSSFSAIETDINGFFGIY